MKNETILIVLPTLGQRIHTLKETLQSIDNQRAEVNIRLLIVAPINATEARKICSQKQIEVLDDPGTGMSDAINLGLTNNQNETYYAWMGDDDLFRPGGLRVLLDLIESKESHVLAFGACDYISPNGKTIATNRAGSLAPRLLKYGPNLIPHPGTLFKLDEVIAVGMYDSSLRFVMDLDLLLKLRSKGTFASTRQVVSAFRWHPVSLTVANRDLSTKEAESVKGRYSKSATNRISWIWNVPLGIAAAFAAKKLNARAIKLG